MMNRAMSAGRKKNTLPVQHVDESRFRAHLNQAVRPLNHQKGGCSGGLG